MENNNNHLPDHVMSSISDLSMAASGYVKTLNRFGFVGVLKKGDDQAIDEFYLIEKQVKDYLNKHGFKYNVGKNNIIFTDDIEIRLKKIFLS